MDRTGLRKLLKAHFTLNGQMKTKKGVVRFQDLIKGAGIDNGRITDAIEYIASATGKSSQTVWNWLRQAENGIGHFPAYLDPTIAMALMFLSNQILVDNDRPLTDDPISDYLQERLSGYYKSKFKTRRRSKSK